MTFVEKLFIQKEITEIITTEQSTDDIEKTADRKAGSLLDILNSKHVKENNWITKLANKDGEEFVKENHLITKFAFYKHSHKF